MVENKYSSKEGEKLFAFLTKVCGHLEITSPQDETLIQSLVETLRRTLLFDDLIKDVKNTLFSFENSDLFSPETIEPNQLAKFRTLTDSILNDTKDAEFKMFIRELPALSTTIKGSEPLWAQGAKIEKTIGPLINKDGRKMWFDFFRIQKMVALYIDIHPSEPVILFNASFSDQEITTNSIPQHAQQIELNLLPDTIWVISKVFTPNAPQGLYTSLKIKGGTITLSRPPSLVNGKLTISSNTVVAVTLDLEPYPENEEHTDNIDSTYGIDAVSADVTLPNRLSLHFGAGGTVIDEIYGDIKWNVYGHITDFTWDKQSAPKYDESINRVLIPFKCSKNTFSIADCKSPFNTIAGTSNIKWSAWSLPTAKIDSVYPLPAKGIGEICIQCEKGITARWKGLQGGEIDLANPYVVCDGTQINIQDNNSGNIYCNLEYQLWIESNADDSSSSSIKLRYANNNSPFLYITAADGNELLHTYVDSNPLLDRPVSADGKSLDIHSKNSVLILAVNNKFKSIYLYDDNIPFENSNPNEPRSGLPKVAALVIHNALFKVTTVNCFLLFGELADDDADMVKMEKGRVFLTFGTYAYLPTLPDPYAVSLGRLRSQFERYREGSVSSGANIWLSLICQIKWSKVLSSSNTNDVVEVSFHFAPISTQPKRLAGTGMERQSRAHGQLGSSDDNKSSDHPLLRLFEYENVGNLQGSDITPHDATSHLAEAREMEIPPDVDLQKIWDEYFSFYINDTFALLDLSGNADQMGVSFGWFDRQQMAMFRTHDIVAADGEEREQEFKPDTTSGGQFPFRVIGMDLLAKGLFVRAFTVPQISWEPVINMTKNEKVGDPPMPFNYYPDDGGPTKIANNSVKLVPIEPIPVIEFLVRDYDNEPNNITAAYFTLPFGLRSLAFLYKTNKNQLQKPEIHLNSPSFEDNLKGGIQVRLHAGSGFNNQESNMFRGYTMQINNVLDLDGNKTNASTLGYDVCQIFNKDFIFDTSSKPLDEKRGVPLTRIDISGYGSSTFSDWVNKDAQFASTSQVRFDVLIGRTAHEVIEVKSILYPWGIKVVRTITLFKVGSGYVYRYDSGWRAESDGKFDFRFKFLDTSHIEKLASPYKIHPGIVKGLFNVRNIRSAISDVQPFSTKMDLEKFYDLDVTTNNIVQYSGPVKIENVDLQPVYFDADIEIENVVQGHTGGKVPSRKILGYVQLAPRGIPLTPNAFGELLTHQLGSIGGPIDCIADIGNTGQKMRLSWHDFNISTDESNVQPVFVVAARGSTILPKESSWSMVMHSARTGHITPLPEGSAVPIIRIGEIASDLTFPDTELIRIANPAELLRKPNKDTSNFGFLQSTNTQKFLVLTPSFQKELNTTLPGKLLSKTLPLFADSYRLIACKGIFPNVGDAINNFGDSIPLTKDFTESSLLDGGKKVMELMHINTADGINRIKDDGYKLLSNINDLDIPNEERYFIDEDYLKLYVKYTASIKGEERGSRLNYDINSFATNVEERWKSRMSNLSMVVDLGPFKKLMTIKGNFDSKKGTEASYIGDEGDAAFPAPQIEFSPALQKVIDILRILEQLQGEKYADALKKGLKIAMSNSNSINSWEYKFEASKEIPVLRFPTPDFLYNDPNAPLKLEASLKIGIYFNSALSTAAISDPKKLLPTAGAFMEFYGRLSVPCISISIATVYAVGQVNLRLAADTKVGPSLTMKFGFGAQVVVGLPVIGNVSVMYMVGVEIYADSKEELNVSAFLLYQGHAEILAGIIGITIAIEAKGTIIRSNEGDKTYCQAQVTFGLDISLFLVVDINFSESWQERRLISGELPDII
jgi:hypothetical protein